MRSKPKKISNSIGLRTTRLCFFGVIQTWIILRESTELQVLKLRSNAQRVVGLKNHLNSSGISSNQAKVPFVGLHSTKKS